jgi:hypothetical protein
MVKWVMMSVGELNYLIMNGAANEGRERECKRREIER